MNLSSLQLRYNALLVLRWLPVGLVAPLLILIFLSREVSLAQVGPVIAAYSLVTLLAEIPTGGMADAYGRRRVLVASSLLNVGFFAMLLWLDGVAVMALAGAIGGASRALDSGPLEAWFVDTSRAIDPSADIERRLARGNAVDGVTLAVGSIIGGLLGSAGGGDLDIVLAAALVAQVAHAGAALWLMTDDRLPGTRQATDERPTPMAVIRETRRLVEGTATLRWILVAGIGVGVALTAVETLFQPRFDELIDGDAAPALLGMILAASFVGSAMGSEAGPQLRRKLGWSARRFLVAAVVTQTLCFVLMAATRSAALTAAAIIVLYTLLGLIHPVIKNVLHEHAIQSARTTVLSAQSLTLQLGGLMGSLTLPALAAAASIPLAWSLAAAAIACAGIAYAGVTEKIPQPL